MISQPASMRIFLVFFTLVFISCGPQQPSPTEPNEDTLPVAGFYSNEEGSPVFEMVNQAQKTVDIEIYQMADRDFLAAVRGAVNRGVRVRIVKDASSLGEKCLMLEPINEAKDDEACIDQKKLVSEIRNAGGTVQAFNKKELCGGNNTDRCFQHGKIVISDSKVAMLSTGNFNSSSFCNAKQNPPKCNRDYSLVLRDEEAVTAMRSIFEKDLEGRRYNVADFLTPSLAEKITISPHTLEPTIAFIRSAKKNIHIQNQYLKDPNMNSAIKDAALRGVNVQVMLASVCAFGRPSERDTKALTELFTSFDQSGIKTRMFTIQNSVGGRYGYLHAKAIVVDNMRAWVGSANGSTMALTMNREYGAFFQDATNIAKLITIMEKDYAHEGGESWQESLECKKDFINDGGEDEGPQKLTWLPQKLSGPWADMIPWKNLVPVP